MLGTKSIRRLLACLFAAHAVLAPTLGAHYGGWTEAPAADLAQWRVLQERYLLCDDYVDPQYIPDREGRMRELRGAVMLVPGAWNAVEGRPFGNVYYSGSAPYKNEPPDFALGRWTMLDILGWVNLRPGDAGWGREQSVALTYLGRICPLLLRVSRRVSLAACTDLQTGLTKASRAYQGAKTLGCWDVFRDLLEKLENRTLTRQEAQGAYGELQRAFTDLRDDYNARMQAYREELGQPQADGRDYPTHCEIMYLYEVWKARRLVDTFQNALPGLLCTMRVPPTALIISKPMCENCEPNIVRAWTGARQDLYVVTEREPNRVEKGHHDASSRVKKIDAPLDGREPYVPTL